MAPPDEIDSLSSLLDRLDFGLTFSLVRVELFLSPR